MALQTAMRPGLQATHAAHDEFISAFDPTSAPGSFPYSSGNRPDGTAIRQNDYVTVTKEGTVAAGVADGPNVIVGQLLMALQASPTLASHWRVVTPYVPFAAGGATAALDDLISDWAANSTVKQFQERRATASAGAIRQGDLIRSLSDRTTGATFNAAEAANWEVVSPSAFNVAESLIASIAQIEADIAATKTAKHGTVHHSPVPAVLPATPEMFAVTKDHADYELHAESDGGFSFNGNDFTTDTFTARLVNTGGFDVQVTFTNFVDAYVRDADNNVLTGPYTLKADASVTVTVTDNGGALFLNIFPGASVGGSTGIDALRAALAGIVGRLDALSIPVIDPVKSAVASLKAQVDALVIPVIDPVKTAVASLKAQIDALDILSLDTTVAAIAQIEADLAVIKAAAEAVDPAEASALSAIASLKAQVDALVIPAIDPVKVAVASLSAKVDTIYVPPTSQLGSAVAALKARLDALSIPNVSYAQAALAALLAKVEAADIEGARSDAANVVAALSQIEADANVSRLDIDSVVQAIAGIDADLQARRSVVVAPLAGGVDLTATASGSRVAVTPDFVLQPGVYRVEFVGSLLTSSSAVGSFVGSDGILLNVTDNVDVGISYRMGGNGATDFVASPFALVWYVTVNAPTTFRVQARPGYSVAPTFLTVSASTSLFYSRVA